jgi:predicted peptidase
MRVLPLLALVLVSCRTMPQPETGFLNRELDGSRYVVYVPRGWTADRPWPVILFLHGAGERGQEGTRATSVGLGAELRWNPQRIPAVVVFPQAPEETRWLGEPAETAMRALDAAMREFSGDPDRVYLTGLSMGGFGTWHLALAHPDRFAAAVPVCGGIVPNGSATSVRQSPLTAGQADPYAFTARQLRHLPVWMFHGAQDTVILPAESRSMEKALQAAGGAVRYSEYADVGHNAWERAYADEGLWTWLFAQRRRR